MKANVKSVPRIVSGAVFALIVLSLAASACSPAAPAVNQADVVATAAVQTLTAIPKQAASATAAAPQPTETSQPTITPTPTPVQPTALPVVSASGPTGFAANVDPLTGMPVADPSILNRRPVLVKVSNWPGVVRPQSGLSSADIVFEYYMGEGMNRFVGLFYSQNASKVGSIRSGRLVDAQLGPLYQAVLASSGAYITVEQAIEKALGNRVINEGAGTCPMFCRDDKISSPNNLFADTSKITEYAQAHGADPKVKQNLDGMAFDPALPTNGKTATKVSIKFNEIDRGEWRYDPTSGSYLRWIDNQDLSGKITTDPLTDANNKAQLAFSNVVVIFATYTEYAPTMSDISLSNAGLGGKAIVFRNGLEIDGTWKSQGPTAPLTFQSADGKPLPFKPGPSWFVFMGSRSQATSTSGTVSVQFSMP